MEQSHRARRDLGYLEPIHQVISQQLARASTLGDTENYQRLSEIYNLVLTRKIELVRTIAESENIPPCTQCGSIATERVTRQTSANGPLLQFQQCTNCGVRVQL